MGAPRRIEVGARLGISTVLFEFPREQRVTSNGVLREFLLACDCGEIVQRPIKGFLSGRDVSCGCHGRKARLESTTTHGLSGSKPYGSWAKMKERCDSPDAAYYENYGGRGITYDPRWAKFSVFWGDMCEGYQEDLELDRIDPDGNYSKENCRWATESMQGFNQRRRKTNTTGRTGVYKAHSHASWWAEIQVFGQTKHLGTFHSFEEACEARTQAEIRVYGFAKDVQT